MMPLLLEGIDGANPLGFFAALGAALTLDDHGISARLGWHDTGTWRPVIEGVDTIDDLVGVVMSNMDSWAEEEAIQLHYRHGSSDLHDLKAPPDVFADYLRAMRTRGGRSAALAACFGSDAVLDNSGATKPTAFHFTAGQMHFLAMVNQLAEGLTPDDLREALAGPWRYARQLPVLLWDASAGRAYALRASDPSKDTKTGIPGADWLAFVGLRLFPVVPQGPRLVTTGVSGPWKSSTFTWPIWTPFLSTRTIGSILQHAARAGAEPSDRDTRSSHLRVWGVSCVLRSRILRSDQGQGSFAPAEVVW